MRESLQATIEEQEATNEELRSANEEIMSSNEELQSTNEELETAKEEMQSTNEELTTLNDELENRNAEMGRVNNDLHNLLANTHIPIVMVAPDLRIRRFTTVAEKTLNISASEVGRPITGVKLKVAVPGLSRHIADVIDSLQTREVEVRDSEDRWWLVRIRPYRTTDHRIDGAVLAFVDIDLLKRDLERTTIHATPKAGR
jgi:two-component system CheB/CheR fusion protein